jgi:hypothetical protein
MGPCLGCARLQRWRPCSPFKTTSCFRRSWPVPPRLPPSCSSPTRFPLSQPPLPVETCQPVSQRRASAMAMSQKLTCFVILKAMIAAPSTAGGLSQLSNAMPPSDVRRGDLECPRATSLSHFVLDLILTKVYMALKVTVSGDRPIPQYGSSSNPGHLLG